MTISNDVWRRGAVAAAMVLAVGCGGPLEEDDALETVQSSLLTGIKSVGGTWTGSNAMQVYDVGDVVANNNIETRWKVDPNNANSNWTAWTGFGNVPNAAKVRATRYQNLAQLVVVQTSSNGLRLKTQTTANGAWGSWSGPMTPPSGAIIADAALTLSPTMRIDLFIATDDGVFYRSKINAIPSSDPLFGWTGWILLVSGAKSKVTAARTPTGLEQVFIVDTAGNCTTFWRTNVTWSSVAFNDGVPSLHGSITAGFNAQGSMQVFARQFSTGTVFTRWKTGGDGSNWTGWLAMNSNGLGGANGVLTEISANRGNTSPFSMHLFGATTTGAVVVRWVNNGAFTDWVPFP